MIFLKLYDMADGITWRANFRMTGLVTGLLLCVLMLQVVAAQAQGQDMTARLDVDGVTREFHVHVPSDPGPAPAAVLVFHGGGGNGATMLAQNPIVPAADAGGFIAVFPEGIDGHWNDGRQSMAEGPDDVAFARALVAHLAEVYGVDPDRVYATGMSNGAIFVYRLACDAPGLVRAIAPVAGTMPAVFLPQCRPGSGTPLMMFSGTDDRFMPYDGGQPERSALIGLFRGRDIDDMVAVPDTLAFWAQLNGCGTSPETSDLPDLADDDTTVTRIAYACGAATLYRINGGGHTWPGSTVRVAPRLTGAVSMDIDAASLMVDFFRAHGL